MLYKYGKKIHDKIIEMMQPEFDDQEAIDPLISGQVLNLRLKKVAGFWNYDSSAFARPSTLGGFDPQLESIYNQMNDLNEFTDAKNFKTYAELQARLNAVLTLVLWHLRFVMKRQTSTPLILGVLQRCLHL